MNEAVENGKYYSLGNLLCWSVLWLKNLQDLSSIVKMIDNEKRGGELVSIIAPFAYFPNSYLQQLAMNMIKVVCDGYPINNMTWLDIYCIITYDNTLHFMFLGN